MTKFKGKNEMIKRKYFQWLKEAEGFSPNTVNCIEKAIWKYEEFSKDDDYVNFSFRKAKAYKKYLSSQIKKNSCNPLSMATQYSYLRHVRAFFLWLSGQRGYKSRINVLDVKVLNLDRRQYKIMAGVAGFEPTITRPKPVALPLGYTPVRNNCVANTIKKSLMNQHKNELSLDEIEKIS